MFFDKLLWTYYSFDSQCYVTFFDIGQWSRRILISIEQGLFTDLFIKLFWWFIIYREQNDEIFKDFFGFCTSNLKKELAIYVFIVLPFDGTFDSIVKPILDKIT